MRRQVLELTAKEWIYYFTRWSGGEKPLTTKEANSIARLWEADRAKAEEYRQRWMAEVCDCHIEDDTTTEPTSHEDGCMYRQLETSEA